MVRKSCWSFSTLLIVIVLASSVITPLVNASSSVPPEDTDYVMIDDYWNMSLTGNGTLIWASGWTKFGHGPDTGEDTYVIDPDGNITWGYEVDRKWVQFRRPVYGVWDLGEPYFEVAVFPQQDHGPYPQEALEYKIWGSNSFDINSPENTVWVQADLDRVYKKGWSDVGEGINVTCNDDYVAVWDFNGASYQFIKLLSIWEPLYDEPEIDAVKGVLHIEAMIEVNSPYHTLNLKSRGRWITVYIELTEGYSVSDINVSSVVMNGDIKVDPAAPVTIGDYNDNGVPDLMVKFRKDAVISHILHTIGVPNGFVNFTIGVMGMVNEAVFGGYAVIRVMWPSSPIFRRWFDFGTSSSPVESAYIQVTAHSVYSTIAGYGWDNSAGLDSRDRSAPDKLRRDFVFSSNRRTFKVDLPSGQYLVVAVIGDQDYMHDNIFVYAEEILKANVSTHVAEFKIEVFKVTITDGCLNMGFQNGGGADPNWVINAIQIERLDLHARKFDFGTSSSPIKPWFEAVDSSTTYSTSQGFGWTNTIALYSRDRGYPDELCRDFVFSRFDRTFQVDLQNGEYEVSVILGDYSFMHDKIDLYAEGILKVDDLTVPTGTFGEVTFTVTVTNGQLNLMFHDDGGSDPNWVVNAILIESI